MLAVNYKTIIIFLLAIFIASCGPTNKNSQNDAPASNNRVLDVQTIFNAKGDFEHNRNFDISNSTILISSPDKDVAELWDIQTGKKNIDFAHKNERITFLKFSETEKLVVTRTASSIMRIWAADSGELVFKIKLSEEELANLSEIERSSIANDCELIMPSPFSDLANHKAMSWNQIYPDFAFCSESNSVVRVNNSTAIQQFKPLFKNRSFKMASFRSWSVLQGFWITRDGKLWNLETGQVDGQLMSAYAKNAPEFEFDDVVLSPDGQTVVTLGRDTNNKPTLSLFKMTDLSKGKILEGTPKRIGGDNPLFTPDGDYLLVPYSKLGLWNASTGEYLGVINESSIGFGTGNAVPMKFSPNGRYLAIGFWSDIRVLDMSTLWQ